MSIHNVGVAVRKAPIGAPCVSDDLPTGLDARRGRPAVQKVYVPTQAGQKMPRVPSSFSAPPPSLSKVCSPLPHPPTARRKNCEGTEQSSINDDPCRPINSETSGTCSLSRWQKLRRIRRQTRRRSRRARTRPRHLPRLRKNQSQSILRSRHWRPVQVLHLQPSCLHPSRRRSPPTERVVTRTSQVCQCAYRHHVTLVK